MLKEKFFGLFLAFSLSIGIYGQTAATKASSGSTTSKASAQFLPLNEVKEGMRGTARTVFSGSKPEEFSVEILGVVPGGIGPKQDLIVGRLSGGGADRTAVFAGMSGSPVYVNGRLLGAISYSFPFSKEPICGITPIEQMISIFEQKQPVRTVAREPRSYSFAELASTSLDIVLPKTPSGSGLFAGAFGNPAMASVAGQTFQPIATPMTFTGFSQETLNLFAPQLIKSGLLPVAAVGGAAKMGPMKPATEDTLQGGTSVLMQLSRGDYSLGAAGTVTLRDGDKIYAFGHPFLNLGSSDVPMSESHVVTVIPSVNNSFKLAVPDAMVGSITQDRATGIYGNLGRVPKMIPVKINVETSRGQTDTINFEVARDEFLTPLLLNMAVYNSVIAQERGLGESMIDLKGEIRIKDNPSISINRRFGGSFANQYAAASIAGPVGSLLRSSFDGTDITGIELTAVSRDGNSTATLERMTLDQARVKAGETFEVHAFARTEAGKTFIQKIPVTIPADTPAGMISITVGDGQTLQQASLTQHFVPKTLGELIRTLNSLRQPDRLYAQVSRTSTGAIIGASEMTNLPPSVLATLNNERAAGSVKATTAKILSEQMIAPAEFIIGGQQTLQVEVIR